MKKLMHLKRRMEVKQRKRKYIYLAIDILSVVMAIYFIAVLPLFAAGIGTTGAQFLKINVGARPVGMGSSYVALADDVNTAYWNPSGFSQIKGVQLTSMYLSWFEGINYGYVGYAQELKEGLGIGGALTYLTTGEIPQTNLVGETQGAFQCEDMAAIFSVGKSLNEDFALGANLKIIRQKLEMITASGYAFDLGALYKLNSDANLGMAVQNLGPKIKFISESDALPLNWKVGGCYRLLENSLTLVMDVNIPSDNKVNEHMGAEYMISNLIAVRMGYRTDTISYLGSESGLSAGMGIRLSNYSLDYAWVPYGDLGKTHRISFLMQF
jgi:hypothetical protein